MAESLPHFLLMPRVLEVKTTKGHAYFPGYTVDGYSGEYQFETSIAKDGFTYEWVAERLAATKCEHHNSKLLANEL